jgi:hypothetical protein
MANIEENLGREGFDPRQAKPSGENKAEPPRFSADSPFPAFRMIPAGSSPIEPELAGPTPLMRALPIVAVVVVVLLILVWWMRGAG